VIRRSEQLFLQSGSGKARLTGTLMRWVDLDRGSVHGRLATSAGGRAVAGRQRAAAPAAELAGARSISSYMAPFRARFGPAGRGERCEPHRGVVGDRGAPERT
jgi:hypothetical protein